MSGFTAPPAIQFFLHDGIFDLVALTLLNSAMSLTNQTLFSAMQSL
jgi:hypothetical protein